PLILIGIGVGLLLARTRLAFLGSFLVAATLGVIVGGLLSGGVQGFAGSACGPGGGTTAFVAREGSLGGPSASVHIDLNCGSLTVGVASGNSWRIEGEDGDGTGPSVDADGHSISVRSRDSDRGPLGVLSERETWRITLPDAVQLDLNLDLNAGSSTMNLGSASVGALELNLNAGSAILDLGSLHELGDLQVGLNAGSLNLTLPNQSLTGSIEANAGSVSLCVPPGAALKLNTAESIVASYDYEDHGLVRGGSTWQTPGFDTAAVRIELDTRANAGSFSLDPEDGCGG
ncbi:MAG: hypothetical protein Q7S35_09940, partial [Candidatus Limnocylindrales bacterium]|nr:hypothetical protein [Candidatus Limnocylindrales bacterium]